MMKKKSLIILLALVMALSVFLSACAPKEEPVATPEPAPAPVDTPAAPAEPVKPTSPTGQLTIGNTTELSGDWVPYFQNNAADYDIYNFTSRYKHHYRFRRFQTFRKASYI